MLMLAACTSGAPSNTPSAQPPSSSDVSAVLFDTMGGDAFAWSERVRGTSRCGDVRISVNGTSVDAPVEMSGTSFRADVPLVEGSNQIVAECSAAGGEASAPLVFDERLPAGPTAHIGVDANGTTVVLDGSSSEAAVPDGAKVVGYA